MNISLIRKELNISQVELSKKVGISRQYLSQIEKGKANPTYKIILKIALALKCSVEELMSDK